MTVCSAVGCKSIGGHKFPRDPELREKWLEAINRKNFVPSKTSVVCSAHFRVEDYSTECYSTGQPLINKSLRKNAVPSIFNSDPKGENQKRKNCSRETKKGAIEPLDPDLDLVKEEVVTDLEQSSDEEVLESDVEMENGDSDDDDDGSIDPLKEEEPSDSDIIKRTIMAVDRTKDEYTSFGEFVAHELRCINSPFLKKKLKRVIQRLILEISEEDENSIQTIGLCT